MRTCVVAIHNIEQCDNYKHLPLMFDDKGVRFIIHHNPQRELRKCKWETNYDLLLDLGYVTEQAHADFKSPRFGKHEQSSQLLAWAQAAEVSFFEPVAVYNKTPVVTRIHDLTHLPTQVLLKSNDGARGVGHIVYDTTQGSLFDFIKALQHAGPEEVPAILETHRLAVELHRGRNRTEEEVYQVLTSQPLLVTEIVPNIIAELRVLLDHNSNPALIKSRERLSNVDEAYAKHTGYLQATGENQSEDTCLTEIPGYTDEITRFLKLLPPMSSVDLYFTPTGWGVFEYCNQFGTEAFTVADSIGFHKDLITHLYRQKTPSGTMYYTVTVP